MTEPEPELEGTTVGEYEVEKLIGRGGFGAVYAATHPVIGKRVALKVLNRRYSADPEIVSRFVSEARAVNQIRHQHIIDIFSFGKLPDGRQYYVMELLDGQPLDRYLREHGPLSIAQTVQILRPIAMALDAAHAAGIAHRDLKPENIFIAKNADGDPYPKLLDFGLAKLLAPEDDVEHRTQSGMLMGTPHYMSPEQCRGKQVDHRTDTYSFGVMTYRLLVGELPFTGEDQMDILFKQVHEAPRAPSAVNPALAPIDDAVLAMLAKDPDKRPPTISAAIAALAVAVGLPSGKVNPAPVGLVIAPVASAAVASTKPIRGAAFGETLPVASPPPSLASGQVAEAAPSAPASRRRGGVVAVAGAAVVLAAIVTLKLAGRETPSSSQTPSEAGSSEAGSSSLVASVDAFTTVPPPVAIDAAPPTVEVEIRGVPAGTRVTLGDGRVLGLAPGTIQLPRLDLAIELHFEREGYEPLVKPITPSANLVVDLTLMKKKPISKRKPKLSDAIGEFEE